MTEKTLRQEVEELRDRYENCFPGHLPRSNYGEGISDARKELTAILARHTEPKGTKSMQPFDVCEYCGSDIKSCPQGCYCSNPDCGYVDGHYNKPVTSDQLKAKQQQLAAERKLADDLYKLVLTDLTDMPIKEFRKFRADTEAAYRTARGIE